MRLKRFLADLLLSARRPSRVYVRFAARSIGGGPTPRSRKSPLGSSGSSGAGSTWCGGSLGAFVMRASEATPRRCRIYSRAPRPDGTGPAPRGVFPRGCFGAGSGAGSASNLVPLGRTQAHGGPRLSSCRIVIGRARCKGVTPRLSALLSRGSVVRSHHGSPRLLNHLLVFLARIGRLRYSRPPRPRRLAWPRTRPFQGRDRGFESRRGHHPLPPFDFFPSNPIG